MLLGDPLLLAEQGLLSQDPVVGTGEPRRHPSLARPRIRRAISRSRLAGTHLLTLLEDPPRDHAGQGQRAGTSSAAPESGGARASGSSSPTTSSGAWSRRRRVREHPGVGQQAGRACRPDCRRAGRGRAAEDRGDRPRPSGSRDRAGPLLRRRGVEAVLGHRRRSRPVAGAAAARVAPGQVPGSQCRCATCTPMDPIPFGTVRTRAGSCRSLRTTVGCDAISSGPRHGPWSGNVQEYYCDIAATAAVQQPPWMSAQRAVRGPGGSSEPLLHCCSCCDVTVRLM